MQDNWPDARITCRPSRLSRVLEVLDELDELIADVDHAIYVQPELAAVAVSLGQDAATGLGPQLEERLAGVARVERRGVRVAATAGASLMDALRRKLDPEGVFAGYS